ncbi:MAG: hypothetical protein JSU63_04830 [Phycisphaerales bacterium]|nr:MAG: hypothetical protein JSU63_04830 [Phycisphaerales bacterium]
MMYNLMIILGQATTEEVTLTSAGTVIMTLSVLVVLGLMTFCMSRILREDQPADHHHAPLDIDTQDIER